MLTGTWTARGLMLLPAPVPGVVGREGVRGWEGAQTHPMCMHSQEGVWIVHKKVYAAAQGHIVFKSAGSNTCMPQAVVHVRKCVKSSRKAAKSQQPSPVAGESSQLTTAPHESCCCWLLCWCCLRCCCRMIHLLLLC